MTADDSTPEKGQERSGDEQPADTEAVRFDLVSGSQKSAEGERSPHVDLHIRSGGRERVVQVSPDQARDLALRLVEAAGFALDEAAGKFDERES
jgi:hypothetical protein